MARLTDDAGKTSGNVPRPWSYSGNDDAYNGLRTKCVPLTLPTNMTYFTFSDCIYEQIFVLPMGSPLSLLLANIFMGKLEENFKMSLQQAIVIMRYLDD
ncbi:unnamed protein product [Protopolystoma xenopodis]|uniref:Reverse transcriptase domain-containing protein n=1 Tax=Protopolystoma xenopodis TaxID=117903 RepID=A0A448XLQ4_9PLAT|nr:unnamed protein product [Protopolystoma xenopodis]